MDEHVPAAIAEGLRLRGVDVLTAQEDGRRKTDDDRLISRASELGRLLFSHDKHMLEHGERRQRLGVGFSGIVFAHQRDVRIGQCISDLELICMAGDMEEFANRIEYLPLR
jgi:hypothetical protein